VARLIGRDRTKAPKRRRTVIRPAPVATRNLVRGAAVTNVGPPSTSPGSSP
jgi:hypothetical protein